MASDLWVFAYGSLMWNPGFAPVEVVRARAEGFQRGFFMRSVHYRGTEDMPGLVLALDECPGARCDGMALRVAPNEAERVRAYLRERELISYAYYEHLCPIVLEDGRATEALTFVVARDHSQYAGALSLDRQAEIIARAAGSAGPNHEYLTSTAASLRRFGIAADDLFALEARVSALLGAKK